jgi:hypothetical protein
MTYRTAGIIILCATSLTLGALETTTIDKVTKKEVLDQQDLAAIDSFVAAGIQELLKSKDFSTIGNVRLEIVARAHSSQPSADIQYNPQFVAAAAKNLEKAFAETAKISDADRQAKMTLNLMILLDNLDNVQLADLALKMIDSEDAAVRYWAVHAITNQKIIEQFNTGKAPAAVARTIAERLAARINVETSPYIISQVVQFGAAVNIPQAQSLLMQTADMRLKKYQTWTVDNISLDETVLRLLGEKTVGADKAAAASRFGQLLSYAMELYIKGRTSLDKAQKEQLASVLVQTENRLLPKLLGTPQSGIKRAIEKDTDQTLMAEYKDLFGDGETKGKLIAALNIDRVTPLPELPKK